MVLSTTQTVTLSRVLGAAKMFAVCFKGVEAVSSRKSLERIWGACKMCQILFISCSCSIPVAMSAVWHSPPVMERSACAHLDVREAETGSWSHLHGAEHCAAGEAASACCFLDCEEGRAHWTVGLWLPWWEYCSGALFCAAVMPCPLAFGRLECSSTCF